MNTMSLTGGIDMYALIRKRHESEHPPLGRKVVFLNKNGLDDELAQARLYFHEGQVLTVNEIYIKRSFSQVEFIEVPGIYFNTVMFADKKDVKKQQMVSIDQKTATQIGEIMEHLVEERSFPSIDREEAVALCIDMVHGKLIKKGK